MTTAAPAKVLMVTPEVRAIVESAAAGKSFKVPARAGAGKTATLEMIAEVVAPRTMLYVCYNRPMADDARPRFKRFANVTVSTSTSLAYQAFGSQYRDRIAQSTIAARRAIEGTYTQRLMRISYKMDDAMRAVFGTMETFCLSAALSMEDRHVPNVSVAASRAEVLKLARQIYQDVLEPASAIPMLHEWYFKAWQISKPRLDETFELITTDELQDSNPPWIAVLEDQTCQKIGVGDSHQSLYAFRNSVDAIETLPYPELPLTQSWRFGKSIARYANAILDTKGEKLLVRGNPAIDDCVVREAPDAAEPSLPMPSMILARTNAGMFEAALDAIAQGAQVTFGRDGARKMIEMVLGAYELKTKERSTHPAFKYFKSWAILEEDAKGKSAAEYSPFVTLVTRYDDLIPECCARISNAIDPKGVNLATVHGAKGLEFDHVKLWGDFQPFCKQNERTGQIEYNVEEANIAYVAVTRAKTMLDATSYDGVYRLALVNARNLGFEAIDEIRKVRVAAARRAAL